MKSPRASMPARHAAVLALVLATIPLTAPAAPAPEAVDVVMREWPQVYVAEGVVEAVRQTRLAAQVPGRVVALQVKAGDTVRAGEVLVRIDPRTAAQAVAASASQVREVEAALANAARKLERNRALLAQKFVSQAAVDQTQADYDAAAAQVAAAKANATQSLAAQTFTIVAAPYAGVVASVDTELGDMAMPGKALVTLFDPGAMRVSATLPQSVLTEADLQQPVPVELSAAGKTITATRATLVPLADPRSHTARVRLELPSGTTALPGQYARARFVIGRKSALAIPASAVLRRGELTAVYVLDREGRTQLRQVRLGERLGDDNGAEMREALAGLAPGERVATNPVAAGMLSASAQPRP